ncbi:MAG: MarR family winged helix-turn-helix transcriptional regulator [Paracoccaceae bacterium]
MPGPAKYRLQNSIAYQLSLTARQQERRLDEGLKTLGLTRISWCVLLAVGNEALCKPSEIADFVGIDRTATSRALRQMEAAGMIARASGTSGGVGDGRTKTVKLTGPGREMLERATPFARDNAALVTGPLSRDEVNTLRNILAKIRRCDATPLNRL